MEVGQPPPTGGFAGQTKAPAEFGGQSDDSADRGAEKRVSANRKNSPEESLTCVRRKPGRMEFRLSPGGC
jgi:hypothetical protein